MIRLLQRQGFIEHKPTSASEAAHQQRLLPVGYQFKLVSLQALHDGSLYCVLHHDAIGHVYPGPEVTGFSGLEEDKINCIGFPTKTQELFNCAAVLVLNNTHAYFLKTHSKIARLFVDRDVVHQRQLLQ